MQTETGHQLQHLQEEVGLVSDSSRLVLTQQLQMYEGKISDEKASTMDTYFYDQPTTSLRRNQFIYPTPGDLHIFNMPEVLARSDFKASPSVFVYPGMFGNALIFTAR